MEDTILTITERLKDLRKKRGLTLEALSEATKISRSALGTYETGEFKGISPFSIVTLAKFYMEIFIDHIASMQVDNLNDTMGAMRSIVHQQYHPDENELFYRTAELGRIPADEYVSSVLRDDLTGILRDIREAHPKNTKDKTVASPLAIMDWWCSSL